MQSGILSLLLSRWTWIILLTAALGLALWRVDNLATQRDSAIAARDAAEQTLKQTEQKYALIRTEIDNLSKSSEARAKSFEKAKRDVYKTNQSTGCVSSPAVRGALEFLRSGSSK